MVVPRFPNICGASLPTSSVLAAPVWGRCGRPLRPSSLPPCGGAVGGRLPPALRRVSSRGASAAAPLPRAWPGGGARSPLPPAAPRRLPSARVLGGLRLPPRPARRGRAPLRRGAARATSPRVPPAPVAPALRGLRPPPGRAGRRAAASGAFRPRRPGAASAARRPFGSRGVPNGSTDLGTQFRVTELAEEPSVSERFRRGSVVSVPPYPPPLAFSPPPCGLPRGGGAAQSTPVHGAPRRGCASCHQSHETDCIKIYVMSPQAPQVSSLRPPRGVSVYLT